MKLSIIILLLVALTSCDGVNKSEFWFNSRNFDYCSDRLRENGSICVGIIGQHGSLDSVMYYRGKAEAYYEMERKFLDEMNKTK